MEINQQLLSDDEILQRIIELSKEAEDHNDPPVPITTAEALDIFSHGLTYLYQKGDIIGIFSEDISIVRKILNTIQSYKVRQCKQSQLKKFFIC